MEERFCNAQVRGGADRQEFCQTFNNAEHNRKQIVVQTPSAKIRNSPQNDSKRRKREVRELIAARYSKYQIFAERLNAEDAGGRKSRRKKNRKKLDSYECFFSASACCIESRPGSLPSSLWEWNQLMCGSERSTRRRKAMSSAVIATAISSGVIAPISSPTGECTRSKRCSGIPSFTNSRNTVIALRFEPIMPT